ncbi:ATP-binding protein [Sulfurovum sp.]|uniref:hybrid sensor histidine kinase/response regulator n=1 Tax=Sulfurovum sp. TaxID=1969726 RepID=UPI0025DB0086|nr:ATP-binding protein [Sulfurovum sp.]
MEAYNKLKATMRREQEYFASIIHDVRTPMNAVMGFLELLNLLEVDDQKKEYINTAFKSGKSMVALINDALDISKMASGKMNIEKVPFSPVDELSDVAKLFFNTAKKKNISFLAYYDPALPKEIISDYHRIKQIVNNLLSNAVKFTPENGEIILSLTYVKEKDGLKISVKDSGIGIAKEKQSAIFTPYTQEKSSTSREYGGTGLGLSISQQLSVLLGGKLQLESDEGKGSEFYFTIPCNTPENTASSFDTGLFKDLSFKIFTPKKHHKSINIIEKYLNYFDTDKKFFSDPKKLKNIADGSYDILIIFKDDAITYDSDVQNILDQGKSALIIGDTFLTDGCRFKGNIQRLNTPLLPQDIAHAIKKLTTSEAEVVKKERIVSDALEKLKGKHILVVDDNTINLKFMKEVLKTLQIETLLAQNAKEGIVIFDTEEVDLIFMDENMPGMQGEEAITRMRQEEKEKGLKETAIIGLTGSADEKTKQILLESGANDVLTKPVQLQEIIKVVTQYL